MKLVFVSNYMNHHQRYLCDSFYRILGSDFVFVSTSTMREDRKLLGYRCDAPIYMQDLVCGRENERQIIETILSADVVIAGAAPERLISKRIRRNKLTFRYSERPLKNGSEKTKFLPRLFKWHIKNPTRKPVYLLCASAFTASDYAKFGLFKEKAYKWGYFTEIKHYVINDLFYKKNPAEILWCGRYLKLKHPEAVVKVAKLLKNDGYHFTINMIGIGPLEETLNSMIDDYKLSDYIHLLGAMQPEQVRMQMEKAGIFLFTSNQQEGWGAVLNESMNSGCAVVASHVIGSVPYLIRDGENGLVYTSENIEMLYQKVRWLLDNPQEQVRLGSNAYKTLTDLWSPEIAAKRFVTLSNKLLAGENSLPFYETGPCSKAEIIDENWNQN